MRLPNEPSTFISCRAPWTALTPSNKRGIDGEDFASRIIRYVGNVIMVRSPASSHTTADYTHIPTAVSFKTRINSKFESCYAMYILSSSIHAQEGTRTTCPKVCPPHKAVLIGVPCTTGPTHNTRRRLARSLALGASNNHARLVGENLIDYANPHRHCYAMVK